MLQRTLDNLRKGMSRINEMLRPWLRLPWRREIVAQVKAEPAIVPASLPIGLVFPPPVERDYNGTGTEILLQGFHWASCEGRMHDGKKKSWYAIVSENAHAIKAGTFDAVWLPPPSDSLSPQGYMPREWYRFDTQYGTENELKQAIAALRPARSLADIVVNHRVGMRTSGADFENPPFANNAEAVVSNDESGCGRGRPDTGCTFSGARDLDHSNADVQKKIAEYLATLKTKFGFAGWRYDMALGYGANYTAQYNRESRPYLSIGECWSCPETIGRWVDDSKSGEQAGKSMAFDFPTRANLYTAIVEDRFDALKTVDGKPTGLIGRKPEFSVTFADNHDTEWRRHGENGTRHFENAHVPQAYAYLLTHPGIPCVFWSHYLELGTDTQARLKALISIRRRQNIHARSTVHIVEARQGLYAALIGEFRHGMFEPRLAMKIGSTDWAPGHGWKIAAFGERYAVWER